LQHRLFPLFIIIILGMVWGSSFILIWLGLKAFQPIQVACLRLMFGGFFMAPVVWYFRKKVDHATWKFLFISGLIGNGIPAFLFAVAGTLIPSGISGLLNSLTPAFTLVFGAWFFGVHIMPRHIWGVITGLAGAAVLLLPGYFQSNEAVNPIGGILAITGTMLYGININVIKHKLSHLPSFAVSAFPLFFMAVLSLPVFLLTSPATNFAKHGQQAWHSLAYVALLGVVGSALSLVVFNLVVKRTTALFASTNTFIIPVVSVAWGLVFKEPWGVHIIIGLLLCLAGVWLVMKR
jgi:drug/metabolite transporter (DMT)-like permease